MIARVTIPVVALVCFLIVGVSQQYIFTRSLTLSVDHEKELQELKGKLAALEQKASRKALVVQENTELRDKLRMLELIVSHDVPPDNLKVRFLVFTRLRLYEMKTDRYFFVQVYEPAKHHPNVREVAMWGMDFPDYDRSTSLRENIRRKYGTEKYFDFVAIHLPSWPQPEEAPEIRELSRDVIIVDDDHECWDSKCEKHFQWFNSSIMMMSYAPEIYQYEKWAWRWSQKYRLQTPRIIIHNPHAAPEEIFAPGDSPPERDIPVLLTGFIMPDVYPFRARWARLMDENKIPGIRREHPGYAEKMTPEEMKEKNITSWSIQHQLYEYADQLKRTKLCLMDSSAYRYALRKYIEAVVAGCLIVGDLPMERQDMFRKFMVTVDYGESDEEIRDKIDWWLKHDREREERVKIGQEIARRLFLPRHFIDRMLLGYLDYKARRWGLKFSFPFKDGCQSLRVWSDAPEYNRFCEKYVSDYYEHEDSGTYTDPRIPLDRVDGGQYT